MGIMACLAGILRCYEVMTSVAQRGTRSIGHTETGCVRSNNQDAILVDEAAGLWLVADGMGGHAGGAEASRIARNTIQDAVAHGAALSGAIADAHQAVRAGQARDAQLADMGTTVVALHEQGEEYEIGWVGDSRAYLYDGDSGQFRLLTRDHNLAGWMVERGAISPLQATHHPKRHVLTDCLGLHSGDEPRIECIRGRWRADQIVLLCSDGLNGELDDAAMAEALSDDQPLERLADRLMSLALEAGARDNVSLVLVQSPSHPRATRQPRRWLGWLGRG